MQCVHQGGVIAYPCEAVYGLGCDPSEETAIQRLLDIKQRPPGKGFILIADNFERLAPYCQPIPNALHVFSRSWPGPTTCCSRLKNMFAGAHAARPTIAVRLSRRPGHAPSHVAYGTCPDMTAEPQPQEPARSGEEVLKEFGDEIDFVVSGRIKGRKKPTSIRDALSGKVVRP